MKLTLHPNELILMAGNSQLCEPDKQVHGKLIITNQRIYFRVLKESLIDCNKEIMPEEIGDMIFFNTKWLMPYGIRIVTKNGIDYQFFVRKRNEWAKLITKMY